MTYKFKEGEEICGCGVDLTKVKPASRILLPVPGNPDEVAPVFECPKCGRTTQMVAEEPVARPEPAPEPAPEPEE